MLREKHIIKRMNVIRYYIVTDMNVNVQSLFEIINWLELGYALDTCGIMGTWILIKAGYQIKIK